MADSKTKRITDAIVTALQAVGVPAGVTISKLRNVPVGQSETASYSVYLVQEHVNPQGNRHGTIKTRVLTLAVKIQVNGTDDDIDPHRQWVLAQVLADRTLGGLANDVTETESEWADVKGSETHATDCIILFAIDYRTLLSDITQ